MPPSPPSVHVGEIQAGASGGLLHARTFVLTSPSQGERSRPELLFGLCAAEAPKRVVEKLSDRLAEELRAAFFPSRGSTAPEARFEAALKQANKAVLSFLYEHGLSLPGIKLRAAIGALSAGRLYVSARGDVRGFLALPRDRSLAAYDLFSESPLKPGEPKFFASLLSGALPSGGRLVVATRETFEELDPAYVKAAFCQPDLQRSVRELKTALKSARLPSTILTLETSSPEPLEAAVPVPTAQRKPMAPPPALAPAGADVGDLVSRGIRAGAMLGLNAVRHAGHAAWRMALAAMRLPVTLADRERRAAASAVMQALPDRTASRAVAALNAVPAHSRHHLFLLIALLAVLGHGLLFAHRQQAAAGTSRAYEASLAELGRLEGDFDAALIVEDDRRGREILDQMRALAETLPEDGGRLEEKRAAMADLDTRAAQLRRETEIASPAIFASVDSENGLFTLSTLARFDGRLYLFSRTAPSVRIYAPDGSTERKDLEGIPAGIDAAAPARTGFLLRTTAGRIYYWNPAGNPATEYAKAAGTAGPLLFYEGRLYAADAEGRVSRRSVGTRSLGTAAAVVEEPAWPGAPAGMAVDGAVYLLRADGTLAKYAKGQVVPDFGPGPIDPPLANAGDLWTTSEAAFLAIAERGVDGRLLLLDKANGRLLTQLRSTAFADLGSATISEDGATAWLYAGGKIYTVPLAPHLQN